MRKGVVLVTAFCSIFLLSWNLFADQWALPQKQSYSSQNSLYKFTVMPRELESRGKYWMEKGKNKKPGQLQDGLDVCRGILEKKIDNEYNVVWEKELDNNVAPVSALVSNSGKYVITFDNWHEAGYGDNVIVIYDEKGELKRKFALEDVMSESELASIGQSVSSKYWGDNHYIDSQNGQLVLRLYILDVEPGPFITAEGLDKQATIRRVDLETGTIID